MVDLSKYLEQASDAAKRRNYAMAIKIYGQVLSIQPDFGEARAGLRKVLFQKVAQKPASKLTAIVLGGLNLPIAGLMRLLGQHAAAVHVGQHTLSSRLTTRCSLSTRNAALPELARLVFPYAADNKIAMHTGKYAGTGAMLDAVTATGGLC